MAVQNTMGKDSGPGNADNPDIHDPSGLDVQEANAHRLLSTHPPTWSDLLGRTLKGADVDLLLRVSDARDVAERLQIIGEHRIAFARAAYRVLEHGSGMRAHVQYLLALLNQSFTANPPHGLLLVLDTQPMGKDVPCVVDMFRLAAQDPDTPWKLNDLLGHVRSIMTDIDVDTDKLVHYLCTQIFTCIILDLSFSLNDSALDPYRRRIRHMLLLRAVAAGDAEARAAASTSPVTDPIAAGLPVVDWHINYLINGLRNAQSRTAVFRTLRYLMMLLRTPYTRFRFHFHRGHESLIKLFFRGPPIKAREQMQMFYELLMLVWQLALEPLLAESLPSRHIVELLEQALTIEHVKDHFKVRRMVAAIAVCMVESDHHVGELLGSEVQGELPKLSELALTKGDPDLGKDTAEVMLRLDASPARMTLFDRFDRMVRGTRLKWTRLQRSEVFWRENILRFEADNFATVCRLVQHLGPCSAPGHRYQHLDGAVLEPFAPTDQTTIIVACHSITQFIKFYHGGRGVIEAMGAAPRLLELMANADRRYSSDVQDSALSCMQQMMLVTNLSSLYSGAS